MKGNESYDPLKEGCFPKINDALNKYTMNTLNYHHSNNFSCEENKETYRKNTLNMNATSDDDNELETYSSIILDKINHFKAQEEKIIYEESRREPNIYSNMSTILNFVKEQNKMNTLHIKNFIMENLKVTEEIKHDKDINNLMRRIEHEEIKELISSNGKRYFMEIRKIYFLMKKFHKEGYFPSSNKDVLKKQSFKRNKNIKNLLQESIKKKNIQIQKLLKQYIILKGYYKNVCKKYRQENELLKSFFSFSNNQSYYLNLKYSPPHSRRNQTKNAEVKKKKNTLRKKKKKEKKNFLNDHMKEVTKNDDDDDDDDDENNMIKVEEKQKYNDEDGKENVSIDTVEECNKMKDEYDKKENNVSNIEEENIILDSKEQNIILDTNKEKLISKEKKKKKISRKIKKTKIEDNKDIKENENFNEIYDEKNIGKKEEYIIYEEKNKEHNVITQKDNAKMDNIDEQ
ncbi:hypothetical protein PFMALIP_00194 [Plasmodium falciparum MaliPS096_E11]|uniref:Uncharacterized protein n=1 Tax=Plasmodium falciparum MaliPS096_E11 TaxID=1036727 RepID=A0A024WXR0_PLAFA|nr:hypothetical protein PFMALIP_00194 [Plasmodium falciparum MaliPS096_E11]